MHISSADKKKSVTSSTCLLLVPHGVSGHYYPCRGLKTLSLQTFAHLHFCLLPGQWWYSLIKENHLILENILQEKQRGKQDRIWQKS